MYFIAIDCETSGINTTQHSIVQLSCIPIIDGVKQKPFNQFCQPEDYSTIEEKAIQVHGISVARMRTFQKPEKLLDALITYLKSFGVKFYIMGFNVGFDKRFISAMFNRYGREKEFFELFELSIHDTFTRAQSLKKTSLKDQKSFSLAALCERFKIKINAHDALSDIGATIELDEKISVLLGENVRQKDTFENIGPIPDFPEPAQLHLHSSYSMVESVPTIENWATWAIENKVPAIAIADHSYAISLFETNNLNTPDKDGNKKYGDLGIIHSIGLYFKMGKRDTLYPFNAWAKNIEGFNNIMKLSTLGFTQEIEVDEVRRSVVNVEDIKKHSEGLIFGFGDPDFIFGEAIQEGSGAFEEVFSHYLEVFSGLETFVELMPISITNKYSRKLSFQPVKESDLCKGDVGYAIVRALFEAANKHQLPIIPVSGAHFISKDDKLLQDCLASSSYESGKNYHEIYSAKLAKEMYSTLKGILGSSLNEETFLSWINNTLEIANRCKNIYKKYEYQLPIIEIPQHIKEETSDYNKQLLMFTIEKCQKYGRWRDDPIYMERFAKEIDVIAKNKTVNFLPYFLMYEDISAKAREMGVFCGIARGSAGGSLLSYYLKIIHINPIEHNLPFERFLSHERIEAKSFADIDSDYANRDPVVAYLHQKFGLGFAQIGTFSKMKTKTAIRQVMMALYGKGARDPEVADICMKIPDSPQGVEEKNFLYGYTDKEGMYHPGVVETVPEVEAFFKARPAVKNMMDRLIGITRGLSRHASGFVVSSNDLSQGITPLIYMPADNIYMTQMAAPMLEKCGLIKADLLSINTLQMIQDAVSLIKDRTGTDLMAEDERGVAAIYRLPDSKKVFREFRAQNTDSSFQFNSNLIKSLLPGFAPTSREDLANLTSLGRPGTLDLMVEPGVSATQFYIDVRQGKRAPKYIHPDLEPITKHTNSIIAFQEQLMEILVKFAGYTLGEADQIRAAIAKKKKDVMLKAYDKVRFETQKRGWTLEQANAICDVLSAYSNYSFNASHGKSYGDTGYITMYLKTHYHTEWWTAVLNNENDEDMIRKFSSILRGTLMPPSIDSVFTKFTPVKDKIYAPVWSIKGVGENVAQALIDKGPYNTPTELASKTVGSALRVSSFVAMVNAKCFDSLLDPTRPYSESRKSLIETFAKVRKSDAKSIKDPIFLNPTSTQKFLLNKSVYTLFNKRVIEEPELAMIFEDNLNGDLTKTPSKKMPYYYQKTKHSVVNIVAGIDEIRSIPVEDKDPQLYGILCLFKGSEHKTGISKKTGRKWECVRVNLDDGSTAFDMTWWDKKNALRYPIDSLILIIGKVIKDWRGITTLNIHSVESIDV